MDTVPENRFLVVTNLQNNNYIEVVKRVFYDLNSYDDLHINSPMIYEIKMKYNKEKKMTFKISHLLKTA